MKIMTFGVLWVLQFWSINTTLLNFFFFLNWLQWSFFTVSPFSGFFLPHYLSDFWKYLFPPACVLHMCMFPYSLTLSYLSFNISSDLDSVLPSLRRRPWPLCLTRMEASTACRQYSWVMHLLLSFFFTNAYFTTACKLCEDRHHTYFCSSFSLSACDSP